MRQIDTLVVHCAATPPDMDIGVAWIRDIHVKQNRWSDVGYHYVIRRDGTLEVGRPESKAGAHVSGHNARSIGVCLVGGVRRAGKALVPENNFTAPQWATLRRILAELLERYPGARVLGHRDLNPGKACPSFDVREWMQCQAFAATARWT